MLNRLYHSFWSQRFINLFCLSILYSLVIGATFYLLLPTENVLKSGDFPAFYAAGKLAVENPNSLYDLNSQALIQETDFAQQGFHVFAYPPFAALFFMPLSLLSPLGAKLFYLLLLALCLIGSSIILTKDRAIPVLENQLFPLLFLFTPLTIGFVAGQNTAISFLLLISAINFAKNHNWLLAGVTLGLWNFKPQYSAIALFVLFYMSKERLNLLKGYLSVSVIQLALCLVIFGETVSRSWLELLSRLGAMNNASAQNVIKMGSFASLYRAFNDCCPLLSFLLPAVCLILLIEVFRKNPTDYSLIGVVVALLSPQTGFYDLALILPFIFQRLGPNRSEFVWRYILICAVVYAATSVQMNFKIQLLPIASILIVAALSYKTTELSPAS